MFLCCSSLFETIPKLSGRVLEKKRRWLYKNHLKWCFLTRSFKIEQHVLRHFSHIQKSISIGPFIHKYFVGMSSKTYDRIFLSICHISGWCKYIGKQQQIGTCNTSILQFSEHKRSLFLQWVIGSLTIDVCAFSELISLINIKIFLLCIPQKSILCLLCGKSVCWLGSYIKLLKDFALRSWLRCYLQVSLS